MTTATTDVWDLDKNLATVGRQWAGLFALCGDSAAYAASAESVSGWGVARQVNHVGIALNLIAQVIEGMLANPEQGAGLGPTQPFAMPMLEAGSIPRGRGQAPKFLHPPATPAAAETRALLQSAKDRWDALGAKRGQMKQTPATFQHFALGHFTCVQWARFMAVHTAHHLKIIHDILDHAGQVTPYDNALEEVN